MALDEPKEEDQTVEFGAYRFVLAPDVSEIVRQFGGVSIDYVEAGHRQGYTIQLVRGSGCSDH
jgi:hypothetical protein